MAKAKIIIHGASGRMGQEIAVVLEGHKHAQCTGRVGRKKGAGHQTLWDLKNIEGSVLVDFSSPEGMKSAADWCAKNNIAFVSGTTGYTEEQFVSVRKASKSVPVLWSANMSVGVNLMIQAKESLGANVAQYDLLIEEWHHNKKKDSPSGTAKMLKQAMEKNSGSKNIEMVSIRGGGVIGVHKLALMGEEEVLTIEHSALKRSVFAKGAVSVALWLKDQKPGLYTMRDFLRGA